MNIFALDIVPWKSASMHCDAHTGKMLIEYAQLLSNAYYALGDEDTPRYKPSHFNTRCALWARETDSNWNWLLSQGLSLYQIYKQRFNKTSHASGEELIYLSEHKPKGLKVGPLTPFALAMPDECKVKVDGMTEIENSIESYRRYYVMYKRDLLRYTKSREPFWLKEYLQKYPSKL